MRNKFLSFLGIARKSGNLFLGMDNVCDNITKKKVSLILVTCDISKPSIKKIKSIALKNGIKVESLKWSKEEVNFAIGKFAAVIGISNNKNIINKITNLIENEIHLQLDNQEELYGKKI